jgi:hypothetical protein
VLFGPDPDKFRFQEALMRLITYAGTEHRLSERNWQQMLRRFDAGRAKKNTFGYYLVHIKSICVARSYKCIRCPLRDPHKKINSCTYLFNQIIGDEGLKYLHMHDSGILWEPQHDAEARLALSKVMAVLTAAEKIEIRKKK